MNLCNKLFFILSAVVLFAISNNIQAQHTQFYGVDEGLSQSTVKTICQDRHGFVWIGTQDGLNRFDGYKFRIFIHNFENNTSISNSWIFAITEDKTGRLWVANRSALEYFNPADESFVKFVPQINQSDSLPVVYGLYTTPRGNVYANAPPFILHIDAEKLSTRAYHFPEIALNAREDTQLPITQSSDGTIWAATPKGLLMLDPEEGSQHLFTTENSALSSNYITALYCNNSPVVWLGTDSGVYAIDTQKQMAWTDYTKEEYTVFPKEKIRAILTDKNERLWIGTGESGLYLYENKAGQLPRLVQKHDGISHNIIESLYLNAQNILWTGTLKGLDKANLNPKKFKLIQRNNTANSVPIVDNIIAGVMKDHDGNIWIGTWGNGLNIYNREQNHIYTYSNQLQGTSYISNNYVHAFYQHSDSNIWIGTRDGILVTHDFITGFKLPSHYYPNQNWPDLAGIRIYDMLQTRGYGLWIATQNGIYASDADGNFALHYHQNAAPGLKISDNLVYDLEQTPDGNIWIGTVNGLDCLEKNTNRLISYKHKPNTPNSLQDNYVVCLQYDGQQGLWIGTKSGADRLDLNSRNFTAHMNTHNGLPGNVVYKIVRDHQNNLWFATGKGLMCLYANGEKRNFRVEEGLQSLEFNTAAHLAADGEVLLGGMNGVNTFYPDSMPFNLNIPQIIITGLSKINQNGTTTQLPVYTNKVVLSSDDIMLKIEFAATDYAQPQLNRFAYRFANTNDNRIELGHENNISFSKPAPGNYNLQIMGANNDNVWNNTGVQLQILVKPHWWQSTYAYIAYAVVAILLVSLIIKLREKQLKHERKVLEAKVAERTLEIVTQKEMLERSHKQIVDSILYASKIQSALLPSQRAIKTEFPESFIFYLPRDVVSGDFYWYHKMEHLHLFAAADCTGHGVPGAMMSMMGISLLNEIVRSKSIDTSAKVLENLRSRLISSLQKSEGENEPRDGMDIAFCVVDTKKQKLQFAGANNSIYIIGKNGTFNEFNPTKNPIGIYHKIRNFENIVIDIADGDKLYMFSDGFVDQFGGERGRKYMSRRFKKMLQQIAHLPMSVQEERIVHEFNTWKDMEEQVDDVMVLGIELCSD